MSLTGYIVCSIALLFTLFVFYSCNRVEKKEKQKAYEGYDEWEKEHYRHQSVNRANNQRYTYDEKYKDFKYKKFELEYLNMTNTPQFYTGSFEGTAEIISQNGPYQNEKPFEFPIAIYDGEHNFIGYIPDGNQDVYDYIKEHKGKVKAYGFISTNEGLRQACNSFGAHLANYYYGEVSVEVGVNKRNNE